VDGNRKGLQGDLAGVEGDMILLDDKKSGRVSFAFADVHAAKLVFTDKLLAATKPLDTTGVDDLEEGIEEDADLTTQAQED